MVLSAEQRRGGAKDPDGTAQTLWGNMAGKMGDRVERSRPEGVQDRKSRKKRTDTGEDAEFSLPKKRKVRAIKIGSRACGLIAV